MSNKYQTHSLHFLLNKLNFLIILIIISSLAIKYSNPVRSLYRYKENEEIYSEGDQFRGGVGLSDSKRHGVQGSPGVIGSNER